MFPLGFNSRRNNYFFMKKNILISLLGCCLIAKLCLTLTIPWTVAHQAFCPWDFPGKNTGVVAIFFSRRSSWPRDWTRISFIAGRFFTALYRVLIPKCHLLNTYHTKDVFLLLKVPMPSQWQQKLFCLALLLFLLKKLFWPVSKRTKSAHWKNHLTESTNPGNFSVFFTVIAFETYHVTWRQYPIFFETLTCPPCSFMESKARLSLFSSRYVKNCIPSISLLFSSSYPQIIEKK